MPETTESKEAYPQVRERTFIRYGFYRTLFKVGERVYIKVNPDSDGSTGNVAQEYRANIKRIYDETKCKGCGTDTYIELSDGSKIPWHAVSKMKHIK
jgi:ribosomal protein L21E